MRASDCLRRPATSDSTSAPSNSPGRVPAACDNGSNDRNGSDGGDGSNGSNGSDGSDGSDSSDNSDSGDDYSEFCDGSTVTVMARLTCRLVPLPPRPFDACRRVQEAPASSCRRHSSSRLGSCVTHVTYVTCVTFATCVTNATYVTSRRDTAPGAEKCARRVSCGSWEGAHGSRTCVLMSE